MPPHTEGTKPIRHQPSLRSAFHVVFQALRAEFAEKQLRLKFAEVKFVVAMGETSVSLHEILPQNPTTYGCKTGEYHGFAHPFHKFSPRILNNTCGERCASKI